MDGPAVAIVIPALNEAQSIAAVVQAASAYGLPIVVDDGSKDATADLARQAGAQVVSHKVNQGYDSALDSGFRYAAQLNSAIIITVDADGQHNPSLITSFVNAINDGADVVVGIRSRRQRLAEHLFALYTNLRFGIKDPLCGMKAYRLTVYQARGHFDSYKSIGTELTIFAARHMYKVSQIPFQVRERQGQSRFGQVLSGNYKIMRAMLFSLWATR